MDVTAAHQTVMFQGTDVFSLKPLLQFPVLFSQLQWFFLCATCGLLPHNRNRPLGVVSDKCAASVKRKHDSSPVFCVLVSSGEACSNIVKMEINDTCSFV